MNEPNGSLESWDDLKGKYEWSSLLVGNGFSQNIWPKFGYRSLFERAADADIGQLNDQDKALFERLKTKNFELILSALSTAKVVALALGKDIQDIVQREESIRQALIKAVHSVHVPWLEVKDETLKSVSDALLSHDAVYCVNYDLLIYWSMMREIHNFRDYFRFGIFDITKTQVEIGPTSVYFPHGGLHLYRKPNGRAIKRKKDGLSNLLDLFAKPFPEQVFKGATPLFVSEGTSDEKMESIARSDYLSFSFNRLVEDDKPMVIFGSSLSDADQHIINAINAYKGRPVAISLRQQDNVSKRKAELKVALIDSELHFFDAITHPLGNSNLTVTPE